MNWQPIDTAPKDKSILLYYPINDIIIVGYWYEGNGWMIDHVGGYEWDSDVDYIEPTHWMPLPEPPSQEKAD